MPRAILLVALSAVFVLPPQARAVSIHWTNGAGGNWSQGSNWSSGVPPNPNQDAVITLSGSCEIVLDVDTSVRSLTLGGIDSSPVLRINGHTLTVARASSINAPGVVFLTNGGILGNAPLAITGDIASIEAYGTCSLAAILTVTGTLRAWGRLTVDSPGASHSFPGSLVVRAGGTMSFIQTGAGADLSAAGPVSLLGGTLEVDNRAAPFAMAHIDGTVTMQAGGRLSVRGGGLTCTTPIYATGGEFSAQDGATATFSGNLGIGTLTVQNSSVSAPLALNPVSAALSNATISAPSLNNTQANAVWTDLTLNGNLTNQAALTLVGPLSISGDLTNAGSLTLQTPGGSETLFTVGGSITNSGTLSCAPGAANATLALTSLTQPTVNLPGAVWNTSNQTYFENFASTWSIKLRNQGQIDLWEPVTIGIAGDTLVNQSTGVLSVWSLLILQNGATLQNEGQIVAPGGDFGIGDGRLVNRPAGVIIGGGGTIAVSSAGQFINEGTLRIRSLPSTPSFISGNLTLLSTSILDFEVSIYGRGRLAVNGLLSLAGDCRVTYTGTRTPTAGEVLPALTWSARSGTFSTLAGLVRGDGFVHVPIPPYPDFGPTGFSLLTAFQGWTLVDAGGSGPAPRRDHASALDPSRNVMVLFGGLGSAGVQNDTWHLNRANGSGGPAFWTSPVTAGVPPSPRRGACAEYDVVTNSFLVYGGDDGAPTPSVFGDFFILAYANGFGGTPAWSAPPIGGGPGPRTEAGSGYNAFTNRLILFGGRDGTPCGSVHNDCWVLVNANGTGGAPTWMPVAALGTPPAPRRNASVSYDSNSNALFVYGGDDGCGTSFADAFRLDHADGTGGTPEWHSIAIANSPAPTLTEARMGYQSYGGRLVVSGGLLAGSTVPTDRVQMILDPGPGPPTATWTLMPPTTPWPVGRVGHSLVVDSSGGRMIVFGGMGSDGILHGDTWILRVTSDNPAISATETPGPPSLQLSHPAPNPGLGPYALSLSLPRAVSIRVVVFDARGRAIRRYAPAEYPEGTHSIRWDGRDDVGRMVGSGVYFLRVAGSSGEEVRRIVVQR